MISLLALDLNTCLTYPQMFLSQIMLNMLQTKFIFSSMNHCFLKLCTLPKVHRQCSNEFYSLL